MILEDRGLVLRAFKLRETSKIVSILGLAHGRVRLVAHGGRGPSHRFGASLEPGNEIDFVFNTGRRELGTLREAALRHAWVAGARRLDVLGVGLAMVELLVQVVPEGAQDPGLLQDALAALARSAAAGGRATTLEVFLAFELALLARLGVQPALGACGVCGRPAGEAPAWLDLRAGGLLCTACGGRAPNRLPLSPETAALVAALAGGTCAGGSSASARRTAFVALHRLLGMHVDTYRYPRSLALLKKVDTTPPTTPPAPGSA